LEPEIAIEVDDPRRDDVRELLQTHLSFSRGVTPSGYAYVLEGEELARSDVTFFSARIGGRLAAIAAIRRLDSSHGEIKSMHTRVDDRGQGIRRAIVEYIIAFARLQGYRRLSLETGTMDAFAPARTLYAKVGFESCGPIGEYTPSPYNTWMTMRLDP
jgi:putative acetyltransferase